MRNISRKTALINKEFLNSIPLLFVDWLLARNKPNFDNFINISGEFNSDMKTNFDHRYSGTGKAVWYPYLLSHMQCIITLNRVISMVGKILLDVWPRASHLISCIARCRWIIFYFILLYRISNDLNYIILSGVERLPQKQLISVSVQIWNGIVLSFLSLVMLSYFHWKLSVLFF